MHNASLEKVLDLYKTYFEHSAPEIEQLTQHGSNREYFRILDQNKSYIGTYSNNIKENNAFLALASYLEKQSIRVPHVYCVSPETESYIQEDCGNIDLYSIIESEQDDSILYQHITRAIDLLVGYQKQTTEGWDYANSYPFASFNTMEITRDFKRFREKFLEQLTITFDEARLTTEETILKTHIETVPLASYCMMHRDFQARNIIVFQNEYVLIDFQNTRKGPPHYDLASLLYQSHIDYSAELRTKLIEYYISQTNNKDLHLFTKEFYLIAVIRLVQSLGSYGIAGLIEGKDYYKESIPLALTQLSEVLSTLSKTYKIHLPYFNELIYDLHVKLDF